ncbi:MAG: hypothetical protein ACRDOK_14455 [Streptosporangiaceae bacterium]
MESPSEPAVPDSIHGAEGVRGADAGTVVTVTRTNPLYGHDAPLIRVSAAGQPDPVTAAIARCVGESGSVYLELPDGRLTVVLDLDGMTWVPRARHEGIRG